MTESVIPLMAKVRIDHNLELCVIRLASPCYSERLHTRITLLLLY